MLVDLDLNRQSNYKNIAAISNKAENKNSDAQSFGGFGDVITSALVASELDADLLLILSDIDGLYDSNPKKNKNAQKSDEVRHRCFPKRTGKTNE